MIADPATFAACENLKYTYFELGRAAYASRIWSETGFTACIGEFAHPICNFAANLEMDFVAAGRLADLALSRPCFNVYSMASDLPSDSVRHLQEAGFVRSYGLVQMIANGIDAAPRGNLARATTYSDRKEISLFMMEQFFADQTIPFRRKVAEATARAVNLELLEFRKEGRRVGAVMISLAGGMAGIYNLCVEKSLRDCGIGTKIVLETLAVCHLKGLRSTLQCAPPLEQWYGNLGFRRCGEVDVYAFPAAETSVIM